MSGSRLTHFAVIGAGSAGLIAARELARAGKQVTLLEAQHRCGGRILSLPPEEFGYPAEGGPEFVHGAAVVTRQVLREAGLSLARRGGTRWRLRGGALSPADAAFPHAGEFYETLQQVRADLPIAEFLERHFAEPRFEELRRAVTRTVEGYDAADPRCASTLALREEWLARDDGEHGRVARGYGALVEYLAADCRSHGASIHFGAVVTEIEKHGGGNLAVRCRDGERFEADAVIIAAPLPCLSEIALPPAVREQAAAARDIGFGNVIKILLRFARKWWVDYRGRDLSDMAFLLSDAAVPTWWTQHPAERPVLTGWLAGPRADRRAALTEAGLVELGLQSLAEIFGLAPQRLKADLVASRAINWGNDPFARGAYSYATPKTREAQARLRTPTDTPIFFCGEALYSGPDMGTVEAALANGQETAQAILSG